MTIKLKLVEEKKGILDQFTYPKILGSFLLLIAFPTFLILPFVTNNSWFFPYFFSLFGLFCLCWLIMLLKYFSTYDYIKIGSISISEDQITIIKNDNQFDISLEKIQLTFLYNGIRRRGFHYCRDAPRSGIAELTINKKDSYFLVIGNYYELITLQKIFKSWYQKKYHIEEFTRTPEKYRLFELEMNFVWKKMKEKKE